MEIIKRGLWSWNGFGKIFLGMDNIKYPRVKNKDRNLHWLDKILIYLMTNLYHVQKECKISWL